jgi:hypothetical protein
MIVMLAMSSARASEGETAIAYEITATAAVNALPSPLRNYIHKLLNTVTRAAQAAMVSDTSNAVDHFILLGVASTSDDPSQRHAAAKTFPRDRASAEKLFKRLGNRDGGRLPWVIEEQVAQLVAAFRKGEPQAIARASGMLLHFTTDAALPFNTADDARGGTREPVSWPASKSESTASDKHRTPRLRLQVELIERLQARLTFEVRVSPTRYDPKREPIDQVFDLLVESHGRLNALLRADAQATGALSIVDAATFTAKQDDYYDHLSHEVAPLIESSLEAAGLLTANLIGYAWNQAGAPSLVGEVGSNPIDMKRPTAAKPDDRLMGSSRSTVVHLLTCQHSQRIKAENRVYFDSVDQARLAGRVGCRTCRSLEK